MQHLLLAGAAPRVPRLTWLVPRCRLGGAEVELGLGIHGEPGAAVMALPPARELVEAMMQRLVGYKGEGRLQINTPLFCSLYVMYNCSRSRNARHLQEQQQ
jgi:dihydroxyacetone kinase